MEHNRALDFVQDARPLKSQDSKHLTFTTPPPDLEELLLSGVAGPAVGGGGAGPAVGGRALEVGSRVEGLFTVGNQDKWYPGTVTSYDKDNGWGVRFDDGQEEDFKDGLSADLRLGPGPWECWFDENLQGLVLSAYISASVSNQRNVLNAVFDSQGPRSTPAALDDHLSGAGTPANTKRKRPGPGP